MTDLGREMTHVLNPQPLPKLRQRSGVRQRSLGHGHDNFKRSTNTGCTHGLAEDLITDLSKVVGLLVIARNSSFASQGQSADIRSIAGDLGVRYYVNPYDNLTDEQLIAPCGCTGNRSGIWIPCRSAGSPRQDRGSSRGHIQGVTASDENADLDRAGQMA
jgi:hypothetical protein